MNIMALFKKVSHNISYSHILLFGTYLVFDIVQVPVHSIKLPSVLLHTLSFADYTVGKATITHIDIYKQNSALLLSRAYIVSQPFLLFTLPCQEVGWGCTKSREVTQRAQLTPADQMEISHHTTSCSAIKQGGRLVGPLLRNWLGIQQLVVSNCFQLHHCPGVYFSISYFLSLFLFSFHSLLLLFIFDY